MAINKENINTTIEMIRDAEKFDMGCYAHRCGTPGCLSGHIQAGGDGFIVNDKEALKWLGLEPKSENHYDLFYPASCNSWSDITIEEAIITLEKLRDTGYVDWSHSAQFIGTRTYP